MCSEWRSDNAGAPGTNKGVALCYGGRKCGALYVSTPTGSHDSTRGKWKLTLSDLCWIPTKKRNAAGKLFPYCRCTFLIFFFSNPFLLFVCAASHRGKGMNIELLVNEPQVRLHVLLVVGKYWWLLPYWYNYDIMNEDILDFTWQEEQDRDTLLSSSVSISSFRMFSWSPPPPPRSAPSSSLPPPFTRWLLIVSSVWSCA